MADTTLSRLLILGAFAIGALAIHLVVFRALFRFGWKTPAAQQTRQRLRWPARATTVLLVLLLALPSIGFRAETVEWVRHTILIAIIAAVGWMAVRAVRIAEDAMLGRLDVNARDNLYARRRLTQIVTLRRIATVSIVILSVAAILITFDTARSLGASVLASAGVISLVAGIAARSTLGNLVAGVQIAFAEPIRLDDVVVVRGEWGNVEEITLTYVVVRLWDRRRLVLPTTFFLEEPFENWTRKQSQVIGTVSLFLDYRTPVRALREELERALQDADRWDGDVGVLQVIDASSETIHIRALVSANDAPTAWDLRCAVRERLVGWLQRHHPEALPTARVELREDGRARPSAAGDRARSDADRGNGHGGATSEETQGDADLEDAYPEKHALP